jgi:hypothetical protein
MRFLAVLLILGSVYAASEIYYWRGGNNDFKEPSNWENPALTPMTGNPSSVELSNVPVASYLAVCLLCLFPCDLSFFLVLLGLQLEYDLMDIELKTCALSLGRIKLERRLTWETQS